MITHLIGPDKMALVAYIDKSGLAFRKLMGPDVIDKDIEPFLSSGVGSEYSNMTSGGLYVKIADGTWPEVTA